MKKVVIPTVLLITVVLCLTWFYERTQITAAPANYERQTLSEAKKAVIGNGLDLAAENEYYRLYFDNDTGGFAIEDTFSGNIYRSAPDDIDTDIRATDTVKDQIRSQIKLTYYARNKRIEGEMTNYKDALLLDQVTYAPIENGLRINMQIGRAEQRTLLPKQVMADRLREEIVNKLDTERKQRQFLAFYILYTLEGASDEEADALLKRYPGLENGDIYVLKSGSSERDTKMLESYAQQAGYTYEMQEEDHEVTKYSGEESSFPTFAITVDYILEGDSLVVDVDAGAIEYDSEKFMLTKLSILSYFGAGKTGNEGYVFLPDGSGTLVNFNNNGSKNILLTSGRIYGPDYALTQTQRGGFKQEFRAPVWGIKNNDTALFGIVENGDAAAELTCEVGDIVHSFNTAYMTFYIRSSDLYMPSGAVEVEPWVMYEKEGYQGRITLRYYFLRGDNADYSGMARMYRSYLIDKGELTTQSDLGNLPFYMDSYSAVKVDKRILGVPMYVPTAVTSFDNSLEMLKDLYDNGVDNVNLRLKAWYNGSYYYSAASKMSVVGAAGGKKGLANLSNQATQYNATVIPDIDFMFCYDDELFDGFSYNHDTAKSLFQKIATKSELNVATLYYYNNQFVISPSKMEGFYKNFMKGFDKIGAGGVSLGSLGEGLSSDFKNKSYVNRQNAKEVSKNILEDATGKYETVIVEEGNAYTFKYADAILNMASTDSAYNIADETVPFMQMVLHGYIDYSGQPINLSSNWKEAMLKAIEYGEMPYFTLNYEDGSVMKRGYIYDEIYSLKYDDWRETAIEVYSTINEAMKQLRNVPISAHVNIRDGVAMTTYENGKKVLVNYNAQPVNVGSETVNAESFVILD